MRLVVPELTAGPYRLRRFGYGDVGLVREASADPYIPLITTVPAEYSEAKGRAFIERQWRRAKDGTGYSFAIADAATDRAVGHAGLWPHDLAAGPAEIGYWVAASARGRGAAWHALTAVSRWALGDLRMPQVGLYIEPWNAASVSVAERAGFRADGPVPGGREIGGEPRDMIRYSLAAQVERRPAACDLLC